MELLLAFTAVSKKTQPHVFHRPNAPVSLAAEADKGGYSLGVYGGYQLYSMCPIPNSLDPICSKSLQSGPSNGGGNVSGDQPLSTAHSPSELPSTLSGIAVLALVLL